MVSFTMGMKTLCKAIPAVSAAITGVSLYHSIRTGFLISSYHHRMGCFCGSFHTHAVYNKITAGGIAHFGVGSCSIRRNKGGRNG